MPSPSSYPYRLVVSMSMHQRSKDELKCPLGFATITPKPSFFSLSLGTYGQSSLEGGAGEID